MANRLLRPGQRAPYSGQYRVIGPRGGKISKEVTSTKNAPLPPTSKPGQGYVIADKTRNKSGRG